MKFNYTGSQAHDISLLFHVYKFKIANQLPPKRHKAKQLLIRFGSKFRGIKKALSSPTWSCRLKVTVLSK